MAQTHQNMQVASERSGKSWQFCKAEVDMDRAAAVGLARWLCCDSNTYEKSARLHRFKINMAAQHII